MRTYTGQGSLDFIIKHIDKLNDFFSQYFEEMGVDDKPAEFLGVCWWYEKEKEQTKNIFLVSYETAKESEQGEDIEEEFDKRKWDFLINFEEEDEKEERVYNALKEFDEKFYRGNLCNLTK